MWVKTSEKLWPHDTDQGVVRDGLTPLLKLVWIFIAEKVAGNNTRKRGDETKMQSSIKPGNSSPSRFQSSFGPRTIEPGEHLWPQGSKKGWNYLARYLIGKCPIISRTNVPPLREITRHLIRLQKWRIFSVYGKPRYFIQTSNLWSICPLC